MPILVQITDQNKYINLVRNIRKIVHILKNDKEAKSLAAKLLKEYEKCKKQRDKQIFPSQIINVSSIIMSKRATIRTPKLDPLIQALTDKRISSKKLDALRGEFGIRYQ